MRAVRHRSRRRSRGLLLGLSVVLVAVVAARVLGGDYPVTLPDFLRILTGTDIPGAGFVVMEDKLPRAVLGALVGCAFGVSGAVFQTTLRNPLASPDIIGVSMGASAAAVFAIVILGWSGPALASAAVVGGALLAVAIRWAAGPRGGIRLILMGVTCAAALGAAIQYLFTRADAYDAQLVLRWLTGSVSSATWPTIGLTALGMCLLAVPVVLLAPAVALVELGDDLAAGLGAHRWARDGLLVLGVLLTAIAVAASGPIAFVAFLAGPIARSLNGRRTTLVGSALVGAVMVVAADYAGAYAVPDTNLPAGVVTGATGAVVLLWLLASGRTGRRAA